MKQVKFVIRNHDGKAVTMIVELEHEVEHAYEASDEIKNMPLFELEYKAHVSYDYLEPDERLERGILSGKEEVFEL